MHQDAISVVICKYNTRDQFPIQFQTDPDRAMNGFLAEPICDPFHNPVRFVINNALHTLQNASIPHEEIGASPIHGAVKRAYTEMQCAGISHPADILPVLADQSVSAP